MTVPVLWDKRATHHRQQRVVRDHPHVQLGVRRSGAAPGDYYPAELRAEIDEVNTRVYETVNNGVYRAGFATSQEAYERGGHPAVRDARLARRAARDAALPVRRSPDGGGLAALHDAAAFRSGLSRSLQVQPARHHRLPEPVGLHCAISTRHPASPRRWTSSTSSGTTYGSHRGSIRRGVVPRGPIVDFGAPQRAGVRVQSVQPARRLRVSAFPRCAASNGAAAAPHQPPAMLDPETRRRRDAGGSLRGTAASPGSWQARVVAEPFERGRVPGTAARRTIRRDRDDARRRDDREARLERLGTR